MSFENLKALCDEYNIKYSEPTEDHRHFKIEIAKGRNFSHLTLNEEAAEKILEYVPDFFKYKFVEGYEAIWSADHGTLECEIELPHGRFPFQKLIRENANSQEDGVFVIPSFKNGVDIEISTGTNAFALFTLLRDSFYRPFRQFERIKEYSVTIKMKGLQITRHEEALTLVEKICAAICFQIDCKTELPVMLSFERKVRSERRQSKSLADLELAQIKYIYDTEALSLYWYAQSAYGMPLLKYLALYQVIEFYFPVYSEMEAQKKIRNILKDPNFNAQNDKEIAKVLNIVKFNTSAGAFGNELSQLKATIKHCIDLSHIRSWLQEPQERDDHFRSKNAKRLSEYTINSKVEDEALLDQIVQRIYNIRCRIVHTKGIDGNLDVLHPQAKELAFIEYDIELANFITHRVMISSSQTVAQVFA